MEGRRPGIAVGTEQSDPVSDDWSCGVVGLTPLNLVSISILNRERFPASIEGDPEEDLLPMSVLHPLLIS
jgi:hypothetical protein